MLDDTVIIIPARLGSTRFPNKPLVDIKGKPMIVRVMEQATKAGADGVYVACGEQEIADVVEQHGGKAILTKPNLPSGTDRIYEAARQLDRHYEYIINVQGDLPSLHPQCINHVINILAHEGVDIGTLAAKIDTANSAEKSDPNTVKAVVSLYHDDVGRALYFSRAPVPHGIGDAYHHIGIYAYHFAALERFVQLPPSPLEQSERLEQLRALEAGMRIDVGIVDAVPIGVDTIEDLEAVLPHIQ